MPDKGKKYNNAFEATVSGIRDLMRKRERISGLSGNENLSGRTVLITGSSSGLGFATAVQLAQKGAKIIMAVRSGIPDKGEEVKRLSGNSDLQMYHVDLSDLSSIRSLVENLVRDDVVLDVCINNAAMVPSGSRRSPQGLEEMFVVNYLSKFYLLNLLLKHDRFVPAKGGFPRIVIVSSESHRNPEKFEWEEFGIYRDYNMKEVINRYGYFKLLLTTFSRELARRTEGQGIPVRALCPGPVNTNIAREAPAFFQPLLKIVFGIFFKSPEVACEPVVYFASTADSTVTYDYLFLMSKSKIAEIADDPYNGERLWDLSESLLTELGYRV